jgi:two-component system sensor histidine kinase MtrB
VASTLAISAAVVAFLGFVVLQQVRAGLLTANLRSSVSEQQSGVSTAQNLLSAGNGDVESAERTAILAQNPPARGAEGGGYEIVLYGNATSAAASTAGISSDFRIPARLQAAVTAQKAPLYAYTYDKLTYPDGKHDSVLIVGSAIAGANGQGQQYYVFSLKPEAKTLALVERTLLISGLAIVLLLAGVAWLVTRQVVTPVRMAAGIAERLADGRLQERMKVRGEDDLARLAASFNKMAESLQRQIRRLEELSRIQRRFVSDVSHELRTPLTTVRMAADVLHEARVGFDPASARSAELLQQQLDRFESLLSDLLEISRHDAGAASLEADALDVRDLVRHVVEATEPLASRRGSDIVLHLPEEPCICEADSRRVERILRNLMVNAAEHGEGHTIDVIVASDEDTVAVAVRDHGIGLRPGEASLVFNRFWRADPARARTTGGTGLGLSIAFEDARLHGGRLQAWGRRGAGSQFLLTLPRRTGEPVARSPLALEPIDADEETPAVAVAPPSPSPRPGVADITTLGGVGGPRA